VSHEAPPVEALIPHRGRARLVAEVLEVRPGALLCLTRIPAGHALAAKGRVPSFVSVEMAAQAAAALLALERPDSKGPLPIGYLVGVRDARFPVPEMEMGEPYLASVTATGEAPPLRLYAFEVARDGVTYATGTLSTFLAAP